MILDLTSLINGRKARVDFEYTIDSSEENSVLPPEDVSFTAPIRVRGSVTDTAGYMALTLTAQIDYKSICVRCLEDISGTFTLEFNRTVAVSGTLQNEENDEYVILENGHLDIDREIVEELLLEFPSKLLCKEECAGLCSKCGKNLNFGQCDCPKKKEIDPRLAILQKLLEND